MTASIPESSGCPWPVDPACFEESWEALDDSVKERSLALASSTLRRLTGYRVGGCPVTVRPCRKDCTSAALYPGGFGSPFAPHINENGAWVNSCGCGGDCSCGALCKVTLPAPVGAVYEVKIDGVVLTEDQYTLYGTTLVWTDPAMECGWPNCQDMTLPDTEVGTFSVTYLNSYSVDAQGAYAAGVLAMEYAKACTGGKCRLPAGVVSVARQGVSYEIISGSFPGGMTGIREVDGYIAMWNPRGRQQATGVWWPGQSAPLVDRR